MSPRSRFQEWLYPELREFHSQEDRKRALAKCSGTFGEKNWLSWVLFASGGLAWVFVWKIYIAQPLAVILILVGCPKPLGQGILYLTLMPGGIGIWLASFWPGARTIRTRLRMFLNEEREHRKTCDSDMTANATGVSREFAEQGPLCVPEERSAFVSVMRWLIIHISVILFVFGTAAVLAVCIFRSVYWRDDYLRVSLEVPYLLVAISAPGVLCWLRDRRRLVRCRQKCGCNLLGNVSGLSPECGKHDVGGDVLRSSQHQYRDVSCRKRLAIVALILLVPIGIVSIYDALGQARLDQAMKAAEALGGPVTNEQLMATRQTWPDDKNGANVILRIKDVLGAISKDKNVESMPGWKFDSILGRQRPVAVNQRVREFLDSTKKELATIDTLKQYKSGRFTMPLGPDYLDFMGPTLKPVRTAYKLKRVQILDQAMRGDTARLVDDVLVMLRIGDLLADEPAIMPVLVRIACIAGTASTIEEVCALAPVMPSQLCELQNMLGQLDEGNRRIACGIRGERAAFIGWLDELEAMGSSFGSPAELIAMSNSSPGIRGLRTRDVAEGITLFNRMLAAVEQSLGAEEARAVDQEISKLGKTLQMSREYISSFSQFIVLDTKAAASTRCAGVGLAVERYRLDMGNVPERLDKLVPKYIERIPFDPFLPNQPLKYAIKKDHVVIYSVSDDAVDNGGDVKHDGSVTKPYSDCGFTLLVPSARNQPLVPDHVARTADILEPQKPKAETK